MVSDSGAVFQSNLFWNPLVSGYVFWDCVCVCYNPSKSPGFLGIFLMIRAQPQLDSADSSFPTTFPPRCFGQCIQAQLCENDFPFRLRIWFTMVFLKMGSVLVGNKAHQTKRIWPVFMDRSQFLEFLTSKSTLGGSLILCNLSLGLKCANCAFALCTRSTWESC